MEITLAVEHHDHDYVLRRGGHAFYSHLRAGAARGRYREHALRRAERLYFDALEAAAEPERVCGAGLLVLQRAALAAEDLSAILHALAHDDPAAAADPRSDIGKDVWKRLVSVTVDDQVRLFTAVLEDPERGLRLFRLPSDEALNEEEVSAAALAAARELRRRTAVRWTAMLLRVAEFWLNYGRIAKSTMHGFAAIAGRQIVEPPGAGVLGERITVPSGPFVVMVNSRRFGKDVRTPLTPIAMQPERVRGFRRDGSAAAKLATELCAQLAGGIERGCAFGIPDLLSERLSPAAREALIAAQRASQTGAS